MRADDVVEEIVGLGDRELAVLRPRDSEALLDEHAFEHEEFLPYWAELWPSGVALARAVAGRALHGARTLELGCGLGLPSIAAALAGGRVLATDWSEAALEFTRENARRSGAAVETLKCSWAAPAPLIARAPWDLVLAADVLYEPRNGEQLRPLLRQLVGERGEVWLADPGRPPAAGFLEALEPDWTRRSAPDARHPAVTVHRLRPRPRARRGLTGARLRPAGDLGDLLGIRAGRFAAGGHQRVLEPDADVAARSQPRRHDRPRGAVVAVPEARAAERGHAGVDRLRQRDGRGVVVLEDRLHQDARDPAGPRGGQQRVGVVEVEDPGLDPDPALEQDAAQLDRPRFGQVQAHQVGR